MTFQDFLDNSFHDECNACDEVAFNNPDDRKVYITLTLQQSIKLANMLSACISERYDAETSSILEKINQANYFDLFHASSCLEQVGGDPIEVPCVNA